MGARTKIEQVTKQQGDLNQRLLYRAYDLILSWSLPETAVSEGVDERGTFSPNPQNTNQVEEDSLSV